jgi:hypothetical protein
MSADHRHAERVDRVGPAALAGGEHPRPRGQLRRHLQDGLTVGDHALGDVLADAVAALDRSNPVGVLTVGGERGLIASAPADHLDQASLRS